MPSMPNIAILCDRSPKSVGTKTIQQKKECEKIDQANFITFLKESSILNQNNCITISRVLSQHIVSTVPSMQCFPLQHLAPRKLIVHIVDAYDVVHVSLAYISVLPTPALQQHQLTRTVNSWSHT